MKKKELLAKITELEKENEELRMTIMKMLDQNILRLKAELAKVEAISPAYRPKVDMSITPSFDGIPPSLVEKTKEEVNKRFSQFSTRAKN